MSSLSRARQQAILDEAVRLLEDADGGPLYLTGMWREFGITQEERPGFTAVFRNEARRSGGRLVRVPNSWGYYELSRARQEVMPVDMPSLAGDSELEVGDMLIVRAIDEHGTVVLQDEDDRLWTGPLDRLTT